MPKNEQSFSDKCDQSYNICLEELKNPAPNWKETVHNTRFTVDPNTMQPRTSCEFVLNHYDDIIIAGPQRHTYVFRRSKFYEKFKIPQTRIYKDLVNYYKEHNLFVDLYNEDKRWKLRLSWNNTEIKSPNIVIRKVF